MTMNLVERNTVWKRPPGVLEETDSSKTAHWQPHVGKKNIAEVA